MYIRGRVSNESLGGSVLIQVGADGKQGIKFAWPNATLGVKRCEATKKQPYLCATKSFDIS